jgi:hypothetical protein
MKCIDLDPSFVTLEALATGRMVAAQTAVESLGCLIMAIGVEKLAPRRLFTLSPIFRVLRLMGRRQSN